MADVETNLLTKGLEDLKKAVRFQIRNMFGAKVTTDQDQQIFIEEISKTIDDEWMIQSNSPEQGDKNGNTSHT